LSDWELPPEISGSGQWRGHPRLRSSHRRTHPFGTGQRTV